MRKKQTSGEAIMTVRTGRIILIMALCSFAFVTGCKKQAEPSQEKPATASQGTGPAVAGKLPDNYLTAPQPPTKLESMHPVTLKSLNITEDNTHNTTRFQFVASGDFRFNIVSKTSPERLVVIIHNADRGKAPNKIPVHNGTINGVEIAELDTGKGKAVSVTILLEKKTKYISTSANGVLVINVFRST